ncbi:hypothetical protein [Halobacteriovorax sp.]|uniref:hypothetical protein n=1 Tax=Halobacteriovorax sp. TaxID=2020862 RepID=UPI003AF241C4
MKKIGTLFLLSTTLISCAGSQHYGNGLGDQFAQFTDRSESEVNPTPTYKVRKFEKKKRGPASADSQTSKDISKLDNKKVYFLSLYEQYLTFSQIYPSFKKEIKTCASFHQEFINYNDRPKMWEYTLKEEITNDIENVVWHLPYEGKRATKKTLPLAMRDHMDRTHKELEQLCYNGFSDNYYTFANYITLAKDKKVSAQTLKGANSLVKMSVVFNKLLIENLAHKEKADKGRGLASKTEDIEYTDISLKRMQALWF